MHIALRDVICGLTFFSLNMRIVQIVAKNELWMLQYCKQYLPILFYKSKYSIKKTCLLSFGVYSCFLCHGNKTTSTWCLHHIIYAPHKWLRKVLAYISNMRDCGVETYCKQALLDTLCKLSVTCLICLLSTSSLQVSKR